MLKKTPFESCIFCTWGKFGFSSSMIHTVSKWEVRCWFFQTSTFGKPQLVWDFFCLQVRPQEGRWWKINFRFDIYSTGVLLNLSLSKDLIQKPKNSIRTKPAKRALGAPSACRRICHGHLNAVVCKLCQTMFSFNFQHIAGKTNNGP